MRLLLPFLFLLGSGVCAQSSSFAPTSAPVPLLSPASSSTATSHSGQQSLRTAVHSSKQSLNSTVEVIEGSGSPSESGNGDLEVHGSGKGYGSDDEDGDGDEVQGSGAPPTHSTTTTNRPPLFIQPTISTTGPVFPMAKPTKTAIFRPVPVEKVHGSISEQKPEVPSSTTPFPTMRTTPPRFVAPSTTPSSADSADRTGFIPFHHMLKPGIFAAIVGGTIVGLLTAILLVMFIVYRMRKKDEGSYALDEPKPRQYGYSYQKAPSNREFYA